jgi:hypothetical protein
MKKIQLFNGSHAKVDSDDYQDLSKFHWYTMANKYAGTRINGKLTYMHRFIMGNPPGAEIDHIDGDGLNNQKSNLRLCTHKENLRAMNRIVNKTSQFRGVCLDKSRKHQNKKWMAKIMIDGRTINLGRYETEEAAGYAYRTAAAIYFGGFMGGQNVQI